MAPSSEDHEILHKQGMPRCHPLPCLFQGEYLQSLVVFSLFLVQAFQGLGSLASKCGLGGQALRTADWVDFGLGGFAKLRCYEGFGVLKGWDIGRPLVLYFPMVV